MCLRSAKANLKKTGHGLWRHDCADWYLCAKQGCGSKRFILHHDCEGHQWVQASTTSLWLNFSTASWLATFLNMIQLDRPKQLEKSIQIFADIKSTKRGRRWKCSHRFIKIRMEWLTSIHPMWSSTELKDRSANFTPRFLNSGWNLTAAATSVVHTGVKSAGCEKRITHLKTVSMNWKQLWALLRAIHC